MKRVVGGAVCAALDEAGSVRPLREQLGQRGDVGGPVILEPELCGGVGEVHS